MQKNQARKLLQQFCPNFYWMIEELATDRNIHMSHVRALVNSGEYGCGEHSGTKIIRKSKLYIPPIYATKNNISFEDLLFNLDIQEVFTAELGIEIKPTADWQTISCPFHEDKHPSFGLILSVGGFNCMSCGKRGGNVVDFIMQWYGYSFPNAINYLACSYTNLVSL